jgi:hypothetical protein
MPERSCLWLEKDMVDVVFPCHQLLRGLLGYRKDTLTARWYFCTKRLCLNRYREFNCFLDHVFVRFTQLGAS